MDAGSSAALHRSVAEADPNLVFIADGEGRIVYVNARWVAYTGLAPEKIATERAQPLGLIHPDDLEQTWKAWERSIRSGEPYEISHRMRSAQDGRYRWFLSRALPYREAEGGIVGWYGVSTDIDAQVRTAERSRFVSEAAAALTSSLEQNRIIEAFLRVVVTRFSDGCILSLLDEHRRLVRRALAHRNPEIEARGRQKTTQTLIEPWSVIARVFDTKRTLLIPNTRDPERTGWQNAEGVRIAGIFEPTWSVLAVPLVIADRVGGTLTFVSSDPSSPFDAFDVEIAEAVARQAATALEHAAAFARERETTERFRYLANATDQLFASSDVNENLETLVQSLVGYWADWAALYVIEPGGGVRVKSIAYCDHRLARAEELRGQRLFHPQAERAFRELVSRHRSRLRTEVTIESLREIMQPFLIPIVEAIQPKSLLLIPLFTPDFDFGALGVYLTKRNYGEPERELFEELGRRVSLALEHAHSLERERLLARTLQELTLPSSLPAIPGGQLSTAYETATTSDAPVGGDWYDAFELGDGRVVFSVGDVAGRGVNASAIMGKVRHAIDIIAMYERDPSRILDAVEYAVLQRYPDAVVTAFVAILDPVERRIWYANAGHFYPLVRLWNGSVEPLVADGMPIGLRSYAGSSPSKTRSLVDAALLVFYTDGVTEATHDVEVGERRLREAVATDACLYVRDPATLIAATCLPEGLHDDDAALLVVGFPRSIGWSFDAEDARAAQHARGDFIARLQAEAHAQSDFAAAEIIFGELVGNVVRHAPGAIDVSLEWSEGRAVLHVIDRGPGFEYTLPQEVDLLSEGGRGLWLCHQFSSRVVIEFLRGYGSHVCAVLPVWRGADAQRLPAA
jgi:PAS domain S-box-containing protein